MSDLDLNELPLLDDEIILELREVMEDEFADLLHNFLEDLPLQLDRLQDAIARGDAGQLYQTGHKFKSSCGSLGALRLAEWVQRLEQAGRSNALEEARRCWQAARAVAAETAAALQSQLQ
ncbi:MAG: Hpt domain-containing protein [Candidatus Competibacteraceae bacterium]|nr:Hpt domain-containing protein [Candidatus Competibacteraceae bacterium]MBK7984425.1 Hpt domain-containing protein [Candidatus Competibacteraceae bacterium]MBK8897309.1 Hpt domain-containing protein [Candidatus Competibacteraceae bacterium]MBK8964801.1 Hpt domain-containing protein [Candidatus Competibacteraceae bacterium]MBK9950075.1 Hpt domain-containing protein [Candidatus Competibacteraceae bacterium]